MMDTSATYIKMCDVPEIQLQKSMEREGDFYWCVAGEKVGESWVEVLKYDNDEDRFMLGHYHDVFRDTIWLPRQDQLQEMVVVLDSEMPSWALVLGMFVAFLKDPSLCCSMEQLWLAFVMKEKYGKVWDGGKWV